MAATEYLENPLRRLFRGDLAVCSAKLPEYLDIERLLPSDDDFRVSLIRIASNQPQVLGP